MPVDKVGQTTVESVVKQRHHFSRRRSLEVITILIVLGCAIYSLWPGYAGQAQIKLDHSQISYQGRVNKQKFNGQGILEIAGQGTYVGHFSDGRFNGSGQFKSLDGWTYLGQFKNGTVSGNGKMLDAKQQVIGKYKNGVLQQP